MRLVVFIEDPSGIVKRGDYWFVCKGKIGRKEGGVKKNIRTRHRAACQQVPSTNRGVATRFASATMTCINLGDERRIV